VARPLPHGGQWLRPLYDINPYQPILPLIPTHPSLNMKIRFTPFVMLLISALPGAQGGPVCRDLCYAACETGKRLKLLSFTIAYAVLSSVRSMLCHRYRDSRWVISSSQVFYAYQSRLAPFQALSASAWALQSPSLPVLPFVSHARMHVGQLGTIRAVRNLPWFW
jgi:hypothetical protein